jgi:competence ComEA-like helix-hairpin-helix protein
MIPLTRQERQLAVFLMSVILAGIGISYVKKQSVPLRAVLCFDQSYGRINVNVADKEMMKEIPGVGDTIAQRIIDYRGTNGPFGDIEALRNVKGLNGVRFDRIKEAVCVQ